jgi:predicted nucleotidyltransferase
MHSAAANQYLAAHFPHYLYHSTALDADLHAVSISEIIHHYQPLPGLQNLLAAATRDAVLADLQQLCCLLQQQGIELSQIGITGSLLLGFQHAESDIDLLCYQREVFQQLRQAVQNLTESGALQPLTADDWQQAYQRRACELTLHEYIRHEQRKFNKGIINRRKFDISLVTEAPHTANRLFSKLGTVCIEATVTDDQYGFDYPAEFSIDHPEIGSVVSFTATYNGQAQSGERIIVAGQLEMDQHGCKRIVVGSSREAAGEYIKLLA